MAKKPKPQEVALLEASIRSRLRSLQVDRDKLSKLRARHGLSNPMPFLTEQEHRELIADHDDETKRLFISMAGTNSSASRIAAMVHSVSTPAAKQGWAELQAAAAIIVDAEAAAEKKARAIIRAGERRRAERS
jgi:hypothetical protein